MLPCNFLSTLLYPNSSRDGHPKLPPLHLDNIHSSPPSLYSTLLYFTTFRNYTQQQPVALHSTTPPLLYHPFKVFLCSSNTLLGDIHSSCSLFNHTSTPSFPPFHHPLHMRRHPANHLLTNPLNTEPACTVTSLQGARCGRPGADKRDNGPVIGSACLLACLPRGKAWCDSE